MNPITERGWFEYDEADVLDEVDEVDERDVVDVLSLPRFNIVPTIQQVTRNNTPMTAQMEFTILSVFFFFSSGLKITGAGVGVAVVPDQEVEPVQVV